jgi:hypothetical protein
MALPTTGTMRSPGPELANWVELVGAGVEAGVGVVVGDDWPGCALGLVPEDEVGAGVGVVVVFGFCCAC